MSIKCRIKCRLERFDQKNVYFCCFFVSSLSPSIINYVCPSFRTTCAMHCTDSTCQHEFEFSMLPSIPSNGHVGGLCKFLFYYKSTKFLSCFFFQHNQLKFLYECMQVFHRQTLFSTNNRLHSCVVKGQQRSYQLGHILLYRQELMF